MRGNAWRWGRSVALCVARLLKGYTCFVEPARVQVHLARLPHRDNQRGDVRVMHTCAHLWFVRSRDLLELLLHVLEHHIPLASCEKVSFIIRDTWRREADACALVVGKRRAEITESVVNRGNVVIAKDVAACC